MTWPNLESFEFFLDGANTLVWCVITKDKNIDNHIYISGLRFYGYFGYIKYILMNVLEKNMIDLKLIKINEKCNKNLINM